VLYALVGTESFGFRALRKKWATYCITKREPTVRTMEERKRKTTINSDHLTDLEKDVLDEYILDIKNIEAKVPLHEQNSSAQYEEKHGEGSVLNLLKMHLDYIVINGEFNREQYQKLNEMLLQNI
jgi:hypothetical protein